jgi:nucleotide-binding universal stress UspA family protein
MFSMILHANDGSEHAFGALKLAIEIAKNDESTLHMVCVEEIPALPEFIEEVREATLTAGRRFHSVIQRARTIGDQNHLEIKTHVLVGHPVRVVVELAREIAADLLVIGATGHSGLYERLIGSRADRIIQLAPCPVLVVK